MLPHSQLLKTETEDCTKRFVSGSIQCFVSHCFCVQAALGVVARMLHCQPRSFGFAGTKDKRGVTTQWVTAFKVSPAKLAALNPRWVCWPYC